MVQNWDKCIQAVPREFYPTWAEFGSDRILTPFAELSADARAMLVDADRLGAMCIGVGISRLVARALGFCVLRLCYLMTALKEDRRFLELALDDIRLLLTFADFRRQVFHGRSDLGTSRRSPTYCVVVEGGGISRFSRMRSVIFQMIHARYGVSDIRELILKSKGPRFVLETHFDYHYLPEKRLPAPSIVVTNSAVFGVDVSVQIHTESSIAKKYEAELHESFQSLFLDEEDQLTSLARIMLMIWLLHPLPAYSEELAYVVFNAAILALRRLEATKRIKRSAFVNQVVTPDLGTLRKALQARTLVESQVRPASLAFWSELPTFAVMYSLMRLDVDVAVQTDPT
jgi:hypothetical protein